MLPKLNHKQISIEIPSLKIKESFRPILAKDEKTLATAQATQNYLTILQAVRGIVQACCPTLRMDDLSLFDLEYVYIHLYAASTVARPTLSFKDNDEDDVRKFEIDLPKVQVVNWNDDLKVIPISDTLSLCLKYPSLKVLAPGVTEENIFEAISLDCIDKVAGPAETFDVKTENPEDLKQWLDDLPADSYKGVTKFLENLPTISYEINYTNKNNVERKVTLRTLNDIFGWM